MKILHISDTHGFHHDINQELPAADVLVHSGDFTWGGSEAEAVDFMNWLIGLTQFRHKVLLPETMMTVCIRLMVFKDCQIMFIFATFFRCNR